MNTANAITFLRLALIPVFVALVMLYQPDSGNEGLRIAAFAVFAVAAISDAVDGFVARHFNQRTRLGAMLDPLADKLLTSLAYIFLSVHPAWAPLVPMWLPVIMLGRDITLVSGGYLLNRYMGPLTVRPRVLGKLATVANGIAIPTVVIQMPGADRILMITAAIAILSLADYLLHGYEQALPSQPLAAGSA